MRGRRHVDMGGICCGMCVDGVPCYGKDDALIDNDGNQGENKKQSKWCVDDSATERVFIPDGETPRLPPCVMSCRAVWLFASREVSRTSSARKGERGSERKKSSTPTRTAISLWVRFSLRSLKKTWGGGGAEKICIKIHFWKQIACKPMVQGHSLLAAWGRISSAVLSPMSCHHGRVNSGKPIRRCTCKCTSALFSFSSRFVRGSCLRPRDLVLVVTCVVERGVSCGHNAHANALFSRRPPPFLAANPPKAFMM